MANRYVGGCHRCSGNSGEELGEKSGDRDHGSSKMSWRVYEDIT